MFAQGRSWRVPYAMGGGFGVLLFGGYKLPDPTGKPETLAFIGKWVHIYSGYILAAAVAGHLFIVFRQRMFMKDGLIYRMLPAWRK